MLSGKPSCTNLGYIAFGQQESHDSWSMVEDGYGSKSSPRLIERPVILQVTNQHLRSNSAPSNLEGRQGRHG